MKDIEKKILEGLRKAFREKIKESKGSDLITPPSLTIGKIVRILMKDGFDKEEIFFSLWVLQERGFIKYLNENISITIGGYDALEGSLEKGH